MRDYLIKTYSIVLLVEIYCNDVNLEQCFLTCEKFSTGWEWRSCQVGNERSDRTQKNTASKFNTSHIDLLYKLQPFKDCFNNKNNI